MRDQYAGDVSDVPKFAFRRALAGADRTLGIAGYYALGDDGGPDGRHLEWRDEPAWRKLDEELHARLTMLPSRGIEALERAVIWLSEATAQLIEWIPRLGSLPYTELDSAPTIGVATLWSDHQEAAVVFDALDGDLRPDVRILGRAQYVATPNDSAE